MLNSKRLTTFIISIALVGLSACQLPDTKNGEDSESSASFVVADMKADILKARMHPNIDIPVSKDVSFKVCLKDKATKEVIVTQEFQILSTESGKTSELTTDQLGCMIWSENIEYNHMAPAAFVKLQRKVVPLGGHRGNVNVTFAYNPWEDKVYSTQNQNIQPLISTLAAGEALKLGNPSLGGPTNYVWLDDVRLTIRNDEVKKDGMTLLLEIRAMPIVKLRKSSGSEVPEVITRGKFKTELSLIHIIKEPGKNGEMYEARRYLDTPVSENAVITNNLMLIEKRLDLRRICVNGNVELGIKLTPENAPENLAPFEGVFIIAECDHLKGNFFSRTRNIVMKEAQNFKIADYLTDKTIPGQTDVPAINSNPSDFGNNYQAARVEISQLKFSKFTTESDKDSANQKLLTFNVEACFAYGLDNSEIRGQSFTITGVEGNVTKDIRVNPNGCKTWQDQIHFNIFAGEAWQNRTIRIQNKILGLDQTIPVKINPLSNEEFAFDTTKIQQLANGQQKAKGTPEIFMETIKFDTTSFKYSVDEFLNLQVGKLGQFSLGDIELKRPSLSHVSGFDTVKLPIGHYLIRLALVDVTLKNIEEAGKLTTFYNEELVEVITPGQFVKEIYIETANLKSLGNRNQVVLEVLPVTAEAKSALASNPKVDLNQFVDKTAELRPLYFQGPLKIDQNNEHTMVRRMEIKDGNSYLLQIKEKFLAFKQKTRDNIIQFANKEKFAQSENLTILTANPKDDSLVLRSQLANADYWKFNEKFIPSDRWGIQKPPTPQDPISFNDIFMSARDGVLSERLENSLCDYWLKGRIGEFVLKHHRTEDDFKNHPKALPQMYFEKVDLFNSECKWSLKKAQRGRKQYFWKIEPVAFTKDPEVAGDSLESVKVINRGFSFNSSFSMSKGTNEQISFSPMKLLGKIPGIGQVLELSGIGISKSWSESWGPSNSFSSGVSGTIEHLIVPIQSNETEKCVSIRINPAFYNGENFAFINLISRRNQYSPQTVTTEDAKKFLSQGLLICEGYKHPGKLVENYFVMDQIAAGTKVSDPAHDANRNFFMSIRGNNDMRRLVSYIGGKISSPDSIDQENVNLQILGQDLENAFKVNTMTYPGMINLDR